ncbi:tol-pal system protein YbgF [Thauera sp.]|uniref:tol-pal system protein YbgF n=1 Tax=Thauera sp. TaxID=1905334 RepID=UPI0039E4E445
MKRLLPLAAILVLSSAGPAQAGLFDDAEARRQITDMRQDLEGRLETTSRGQLELANQNEQLRAEVARLRGQIELLVNEVDTLKQRQRDFYVDLDTRLRQIETSGATATGAAANADPAAESADYEAALNLLKEGKHREALTAFDAFVAKYPAGNFSAGAHFWAGNAALQAKDINAATRHFNTVLTKWPNENVAPDALLGLANSQQSIGDAATSRRTLQTLVERYPQSNAAQVAKQRLGKR